MGGSFRPAAAKEHEAVQAREEELVAVAVRKACCVRIGGTRDYRMAITTDSVLRAGLEAHGAGLGAHGGALRAHGGAFSLTLDPRFQGLPGAAHGGTVLAAFHAVADVTGAQRVDGAYRKRVPLGTPLRLAVTRDDGGAACRLFDLAGTPLVDGVVRPAGGPTPRPTPAGDDGAPLPVSSACFACGVDNALGLRVRLAFDDERVWTRWTPREIAARPDGSLAPIALTALLDETAFWLGVLASGESGMTTELSVALYRPVAFGEPVVVAGARGDTRARDDGRFWDTAITAADLSGEIVASARITFVAVRGAARRLVSGLLALNPPEVLRRVFPTYAD